jgi:hypothetical protein
MKNKTINEIEHFIFDYGWNSITENKKQSDILRDCVLGGYEIAQKEIKRQLLDKLNHYKSNLQEETKVKLNRLANKEKIRELEIKIETIKELMKQYEKAQS